jgi:predicted nuclease of restriction endonuclease-like RecB superfamily
MTKGFDRFERQLASTGRERMDGFDPAMFEAMTPAEKQKSFEMLAGKFAIDPDESVVKAMFWADPKSATQLFELNVPTHLSGDTQFIIYTRLWSHTHSDH